MQETNKAKVEPINQFHYISSFIPSRLLFRRFYNNFYPSAPTKKSHGIILKVAVAYFSVVTDEAFQVQNLYQHLLYTGQTEGIIYVGREIQK
jgi:hypothetical protein